MIGGHYTYARVPLGFWMRDAVHLARHSYDRSGHVASGFVPADLRDAKSPARPQPRGGSVHSCASRLPYAGAFDVSVPAIFPEMSPNSAPAIIETATRMNPFARLGDISLSLDIASGVCRRYANTAPYP